MKFNSLKIRFILIALLMVGSQLLYAQQNTIKGTVTDKQLGEPLPGVTIVVSGTTNGTVSDIDGNYSINVNRGQVLDFSFIGYEKVSIPIIGQKEINVKMGVNSEDLEEVLIIGYGTVKKNDATGSVSSISSDDFNMGAITSPQELITGKSAGVVITNHGGQAGAGSTIRIRGGSSLRANNDPLIVVDGFPIDNVGINGLANPLSTINPNDIESMTILKDASATAIYGSRASNGVIMITTKKGKKGSPMKITYNGNTSVGMAARFVDVLDGDEYRALIQSRVDEGSLTKTALTRLGQDNTNWQNEVYRTAISSDHSLSIRGNAKNIPYRVSLGYTNQNGILKENNMGRTTLDISATPTFLENHLKVNLNVKGVDINNNFSNDGARGASVTFDPTQPIKNGNERYGGYFAWTVLGQDPLEGPPVTIATQNPVAQIDFRDNTSHVNRLITSAQIDYTFHGIPELKANLNTGYDISMSEGHDIVDPRASWAINNPSSNVRNYSQTLKNEMLDFYFSYNKDLANSSNLNATAGYSYQHFYQDAESIRRSHDVSLNDEVTEITRSENYLVSFFGRVNYNLLDKYLFTATVREDGSSRFDKGNRWGLFPSAALAWKINNESFLQNVDEISELKLRLGWGITGQQDISGNYYPYIPTYVRSEPGAYYQFGDKFYPTLRPNPYDAGIKWEETITYNIGLDFGLFNDRLFGSVETYLRITNDLINDIPISNGTNFSNFLETNVGSLENKGIEANLTYRPVITNDLLIELSGTFAYNVNEIKTMTQVDDPGYEGYDTGGIAGGVGNNVQKNSIGHPSNSFFLFQQVYDNNWDPIEGLYVDRSGDPGKVGVGSNAMKYFAGTPAPDYTFGFNAKVVYKQFDFALNARANVGNYVYNNNASNMAILSQLYNQSGYLSNILNDYSKANFEGTQYWSDFYLEDASFLRLDNVSLGYNFDKLFSKDISGRVGLTVQNAMVYTKYSGLDPEVNGGIDNNIYPRPRTFMLGLNLNF